MVAAGLLAAGPAFGLEESGSIHGIVVAEDGEAPLPAALVVVDGTTMSATTRADGGFAIMGVEAGSYRLTVTREAFAPSTATVTVVAGQPALVAVWLPAADGPASDIKETGSIRGTVVAEDGGAPLPAALVVLDGARTSATTGDDGGFAIEGVEAGSHRLTVTREAFAPATATVTVAPGQPASLIVRLPVRRFE